MTHIDGFDFLAMQAQGNSAGVPELFVLIMTPLPLVSGPVTAPDEPHPLKAHYAYVHRLIEKRKVLAIGPALSDPINPVLAPVPPGLGILNVETRQEAEDIAANEPFHVMGWRHNEVMAWTPKFGSLIEVLRAAATGRG